MKETSSNSTNATNSTEARASVTFSLTTPKGYPILLTAREDDLGALLELVKDLDESLTKAGYQPERKNVFAMKPKPELLAEKCPKCGNPLVKFETKPKQMLDGTTSPIKRGVKCSTSRYDFAARTAVGCDYVKWDESI